MDTTTHHGKPAPPDPAKAYERLRALCNAGEHCEADLRLKLLRRGIDGATATALLARLRRERLIDDARFAGAFARTKLAAGWGPAKIAAALRLKRLPSAVIAEAVEELDPEAVDTAMLAAIRAKARTPGHAEGREQQARTVAFAMRRGFSAAAVSAAIKEGRPWQ